MEGIIFNIKRYAIHDGPGIRVTFFMKGCPLACLWCHNPEGISPEIRSIERIDRIGEKEFRVMEQVGKAYRVSDLEQVVSKERVFIEESGGGITFSGGEPLMQHKFVLEALKRFRELELHTCLDTSGQTSPGVIDSVLPYTNLFLLDIKHMSEDLHKQHTGVSNRQILGNYKRILESGRAVQLRIPVIPGYNDSADELKAMRDYIVANRRDNLKRIDLLPYHKIGSSKYARFGMEYRMNGVEQPSAERMKEVKKFFEETGIKVKIGG